MPDPAAPDWEEFLRHHESSALPELDLTTLLPGDRVLVLTEQTAYTFTIGNEGQAELITNRADRPAGPVQISGCTFGASSTIKPDRLFCGGNVEFTHGDPRRTYTTTRIRGLQLLRSSSP